MSTIIFPHGHLKESLPDYWYEEVTRLFINLNVVFPYLSCNNVETKKNRLFTSDRYFYNLNEIFVIFAGSDIYDIGKDTVVCSEIHQEAVGFLLQ